MIIKLVKEENSTNYLNGIDMWELGGISITTDDDDWSWATLRTNKGEYELWIVESTRDLRDTYERVWKGKIGEYFVKFKELTGELIYSKYAV